MSCAKIMIQDCQREQPRDWKEKADVAAARFGRLDVLQLLSRDTAPRGRHLTRMIIQAAAKNGKNRVLEWVRDEKRGYFRRMLSYVAAQSAAGAGRIDVLQWARNNGYNWS